ncbi:MAG: c-type cytochrome domain-containing protein [Planctomycetaceae bacterium]
MSDLLKILFCLICVATPAVAADIDFVRDVRPLLQRHCTECHGQKAQKSGLRLDVRAEVFRGGDNYGPAIVAGMPEQSPLIELITSDDDSQRMPPESQPLSEAEVAVLTDWVRQGAHWPDGADFGVVEDLSQHWSFRPPDRPEVPIVQHSQWAKTSIDHFILASLNEQQISPSPEADPATWLRRVSLDLIGLPPDPSDVADFLRRVRDADPQAVEAAFSEVVDRLLTSEPLRRTLGSALAGCRSLRGYPWI